MLLHFLETLMEKITLSKILIKFLKSQASKLLLLLPLVWLSKEQADGSLTRSESQGVEGDSMW